MPTLFPGDKSTSKSQDKAKRQSSKENISPYIPIYLPGSEIMDFSSKHGFAGGSGANVYTDFDSTHMEVGINPKSPHRNGAVSIRTQEINVDNIDYFYINMTSVYMHGPYSIKSVGFYSSPDGTGRRYTGPGITGGLLTVDAREWTGNGYLHVGAKQSESDTSKRYPYWFGISRMWVVFNDGAKGVFVCN